MTPAYKSSIPSNARERITERYPSGEKERAEVRMGRKLVGIRLYFESGDPEHEYGLKGSKKQGVEYWWFGPGKLDSAEPFADGLSRLGQTVGSRGAASGNVQDGPLNRLRPLAAEAWGPFGLSTRSTRRTRNENRVS